MEAAVQTNQFDTDIADYASVAMFIIYEILRSKNMLKEIESPQIQLNVTKLAATKLNQRLDQVLAKGADREVARLNAGPRFPNASEIHCKQSKEPKSCIIHLRNKLGPQPTIYINLRVNKKYNFYRFARDASDQVRHLVSGETRALDCPDLNIFLETEKIS